MHKRFVEEPKKEETIRKKQRVFGKHIKMNVAFTHQQKHFYSFKEHIKIYTKKHINIAPTCFGLRSSSESLH